MALFTCATIALVKSNLNQLTLTVCSTYDHYGAFQYDETPSSCHRQTRVLLFQAERQTCRQPKYLQELLG